MIIQLRTISSTVKLSIALRTNRLNRKKSRENDFNGKKTNFCSHVIRATETDFRYGKGKKIGPFRIESIAHVEDIFQGIRSSIALLFVSKALLFDGIPLLPHYQSRTNPVALNSTNFRFCERTQTKAAISIQNEHKYLYVNLNKLYRLALFPFYCFLPR